MRRTGVFLVAAALLLALSAGVALARSLTGDNGDNLIVGTDKADFIDGNKGNDQLYGERGRDTILGGEDNDLIVGGRGPDRLVGGKGDDTIYGGRGNDAVNGGPGNDTIILSDDPADPSGADMYACGTGDDTVYVSGSDNSQLLDDDNCINSEGKPETTNDPPPETPVTPDLEPGVYPLP